MSATYDIRIWSILVYEGSRGRTYAVRWVVGGRLKRETFGTAALADSYRSELLSAARRGEAFALQTGLPVSWHRSEQDVSWYNFACGYVDSKWKHAAATYRRGIAEALTTVTPVMLVGERGRPADRVLRSALSRWAFNTQRRAAAPRSADVDEALRWAERNSRPVSALTDTSLVRAMLDAAAVRLDGEPAAATVFNRKRAVLSNALGYAVELGLLSSNPLGQVKWRRPRSSRRVDRRSVVNPIQARTLLREVGNVQRSGPRLVAFFGLMYFAALRPEEAIGLRQGDLELPARGWGEIVLEGARPDAGRDWTDDAVQRDHRQLKHRARGETRRVPCPPELSQLLNEHLARFGTAADGRLFCGERSSEVPSITYTKVWRRARALAFIPKVAASPLAARPYDLRHAAVSTWLNGGVAPTQVAEWAGHSVAVLLDVYASCLVGQDAAARRRVEAALRQE